MGNKHEPGTKDNIIVAAYKVLAEQGYDKASMKEIAREAGVAQGLINYYFPSKEDLLFEVFKRETKRYCAEIRRMDEIPLHARFIREAVLVPCRLVDEFPEGHRLRYELFAIGLRSRRGMHEIAESLAEGRKTAMLTMDRLPLGEGIHKEAISAIIVAALDGLSLQKMSDPDFDADAAYLELAKLLEIYMAAHQLKE